ncbi:Thiol-disulfide exchange intermediate [Fasciolopsis buskii]|uniref:Thiol-disulfide exchange intermediate n=1 Tax=Fasciolopsis buskii TaxID=27845 RepID=A0A8E0S5A7_9TREM|nr:Thiol-disulfide exchange intermediate [Fasciolopsis buski]
MLVQIENKTHFDLMVSTENEISEEPIIIDFFATWCRPCKEIAPLFTELSSQYENVKFLKIDVDKNEEIAVTYNVRSLPTFLFLRGTKVVDRLMGANAEKLKSKVQKHCKLDLAEPGSQSSSESKKQPDLSPFLALAQCECLNEDDSHPLSSILEPKDVEAHLLSDTDAQLVIYITFSQFIKLRSIQLNGPATNGPKTIKLFVNQTATPDFDNCEKGDAVQMVELLPSDLEDGKAIPLNFVKFQNVISLTIFVKDNQDGSEITRIDRLKFFGNPVNTTNMQNFKRVAGKSGEGHSGV